MNHSPNLLLPEYLLRKNAADFGGIWQYIILLALLRALALLVSDTAAGLASGLAGGLALAAATLLCALAQIACLNRLDMFHNFTFRKKSLSILYHKVWYLSIIFAHFSCRFFETFEFHALRRSRFCYVFPAEI